MLCHVKQALAAAALSTTLFSVARADYTPIFGGLTYDSLNGDGMQFTTNSFRGAPFVVGNGFASGWGTGYADGVSTGQTAYRVTVSGGVALTPITPPPSPAFSSTIGSAISLNGTEVGYSEKFSGSTDLGSRAVLWAPNSSTAVELQTLGASTTGVSNTFAVNVSPNGSFVAGYAQKYSAAGAVLGDRAALWDAAGNITELTMPGITDSSAFRPVFTQFYATAVTDSGVAVGQFNTGNGGGTRAARWNAAGVGTEMGNLGTANGLATGSASAFVSAVNASGVSVGNSTKYVANVSQGSRAVRWDATGTITELGNLGTYGTNMVDSSAVAINASGVAVGSASLTGTNDRRAVRWGTDNVAVQLGTLPGGTTTAATSINNEGLVVGNSTSTNGGKAVIWGSNNTAVDINTLIDPSLGWTIGNVGTITNENWVGGIGTYDPDGAAGPIAAYSRSFIIRLPQSTLYYTGSQNSTLSSVVGGATNFSKDAAGTVASSTVPGGITDVYFGATTSNTANFTTTLGTDLTVATLTLGVGAHATTPVTIGGANTLKITATSTSLVAGTGITINSGSAANTISANVAVANNQSWINNAASAFTVSGAVALGTSSLTLAGTGTQVISGAITGTGGITKLANSTVALSGANTYSGTTTIAAGAVTAKAAAYNNVLTNTGGVDIKGGKFVLDYTGGSSPVSQIKTILDAGYAGGFATGQVRSTTAAAASKTLGYGDNGAGAVTVMYTLPGDSNLDGTVDFNDFLVLQNNFNVAGTRFDQGNFNYDGSTNFNDFLVLQNNFGQSITGAAVAFTTQEVAAITAFASANAVPEPASLAVLGLGGLLLGRRRR